MLKTAVTNVLLIGSLVLAQQSYAADCMDTAKTQDDMNICAQSKAKAASEMMIKLEREIEAALDNDQKKQFMEAQKAWRVMTENDCKIEGAFYKDGSVKPMVMASCKERRANSRIYQARYYLCPEWEMTGICPAEQKYDVMP